MKHTGWTLIAESLTGPTRSYIIKKCDPVTECTVGEVMTVLRNIFPDYPGVVKEMSQRLVDVGSAVLGYTVHYKLYLAKHYE